MMLPPTVERLTTDWGTPGLTFWTPVDVPALRWQTRNMAAAETLAIVRLGSMTGRESRRINAATFRQAYLIPLLNMAPRGQRAILKPLLTGLTVPTHYRVIYFAEVFDI